MRAVNIILIAGMTSLGRPVPAQRLDSLAVKERFNKRLNVFQFYLTTIASNLTSAEDKQTAIEQTLGMFEKGSTIQITSARKPRQISTYSLNEYLQNLALLGYATVSFNAVDNNIKPVTASATDSNYHFIGTFRQTFNGRKKSLDYADVTRKTVEFTLIPEQDPFTKSTDWLILFKTVQISK